MALTRARFLSLLFTTIHGANSVSVRRRRRVVVVILANGAIDGPVNHDHGQRYPPAGMPR